MTRNHIFGSCVFSIPLLITLSSLTYAQSPAPLVATTSAPNQVPKAFTAMRPSVLPASQAPAILAPVEAIPEATFYGWAVVNVLHDDCGWGGYIRGCPPGYILKGQWHTGPGRCDSAIEGYGPLYGNIDSGWMGLCLWNP